MLSIQPNYSRLFRPWDISDRKTENTIDVDNNTTPTSIETKISKKKRDEEKRECRLRKIRGSFKKPESVHQDSTVSTTTEDEEVKKRRLGESDSVESTESPVASLTMCCDRLLQQPEKKNDYEQNTFKESTKAISLTENLHSNINPSGMPIVRGYDSAVYASDYLPSTDIAQALGVPPTDPFFLESLAQGYAMELEYARIMHQENEAKLLNSRKQRPKKYKCPHCQVGFSNNGQLKGHIRIHTGERPYKCDEKNCGKTFTRNEELTRHKRIHSGVRPFPCPTCGKKFGRRDHLKKHTRTHYLQAERMMPVFVPLSAVPHIGGFPYLYSY